MLNKAKGLLKRITKKSEKIYSTLLLTGIIAYAMNYHAYASTPKIVSGTISLFTTALTWVTALIPVGAGLFLALHSAKKSWAQDEGSIAQHNKLMKNVIIWSAVGMTASGTIAVVLSFYR